MKTETTKAKMKFLDATWSIVVKFVSLLLVILLPVRPVMIAVGVLVIADMITGLIAARKQKRSITSSKLRRTISKTLAYQSAIVIAFVIETYLMDGVPVVKTVAGLIGLTEGKSFFENLHVITGIDFLSKFLELAHIANDKTKED